MPSVFPKGQARQRRAHRSRRDRSGITRTTARALAAIALACLAPFAAKADIHLACTFPTLPSFYITYPEASDAAPTLHVENRPPVPMTTGSGRNRIESGTVDGYSFQFMPGASYLELRQQDSVIGAETGKCVRIGGPVNDTPLALSAPRTEPAQQDTPSASHTGNWTIRQDKSQFDDTPLVILRLDSRDDVAGRFGGRATPSLILRCMENTTVLFINPGDHFVSDIQGYGKVTYRIDDQQAASWSMAASTDNQVLGLWSGGKSIPQIKKLMQGETLLIRLTPFNESALEFGFDLSGLDTAIQPLRSACNW